MKQGGIRKGPLQVMGVEKYLDGTRELHGGYGYTEFKKMISIKSPNIAEISRKMNVKRPAIYRWAKAARIAILREKDGEEAFVPPPTPPPSEAAPEQPTEPLKVDDTEEWK